MQRYFFINYKLEPVTMGDKGVELTGRLIDAAITKPSVKVIFVPQLVSLAFFAREFASRITLFSPHIDLHKPGQGTGFVSAESVADIGCLGTVLNHAEHKLSPDVLGASVQRAHESGLQVIVCADSLSEAEFILNLEPDFIAYEPPELIGGDISVASADPDVVKRFVTLVAHRQNSPIPIIGAGIKSRRDVEMSFRLGAKGVFISSGVVRAQDPVASFRELLGGFVG